MKVIIKYYQFQDLIVPAMMSYPDEFNGHIYGYRTSRVYGDSFVVEKFIVDVTSSRQRDRVEWDDKKEDLANKVMKTMADAKYIGFIHSHIPVHNEDYTRKPKTLNKVIKLLSEQVGFSKADVKLFEQNRNYVYLIMSLFKTQGFKPRQLNNGDLFGSLLGYSFVLSSYYWNGRKQDFCKAKTECAYLLGFKGFRNINFKPQKKQ